jgi:hypothetical protein
MTLLNSLFCCFETSYLMQTRKCVAPLEPPQGANGRADKNGLSRVRRATQTDISDVRNTSRRWRCPEIDVSLLAAGNPDENLPEEARRLGGGVRVHRQGREGARLGVIHCHEL